MYKVVTENRANIITTMTLTFIKSTELNDTRMHLNCFGNNDRYSIIKWSGRQELLVTQLHITLLESIIQGLRQYCSIKLI